MNERILVIEDETTWVELLTFWLRKVGYRTEAAVTGREGLEAAQKQPPDCILLDLVLPDQSGTEVCMKLRALPLLSRIPIILFTSHRREKVLGLQSGADYFVAKTGEPHELLATLEAVFRRREKEQGLLARGPLTLRAQDRQVLWNGGQVATLTPKMFTLLHVLVERCPQPVSRADLYQLVEGQGDPGESRALDVLLNRLRKVLPQDIGRCIISVKNFGYVFVEDPPRPPA